MKLPRVYIDFNDGGNGTYVFVCRGSLEDIARQNLVLTEGMRLEVYDSELVATGTVGKTKANDGWPGEGYWMIVVDEDSWRDISSDGTETPRTK